MRCGLIGERLGHSYSKWIHERFGAYSYDLCSLAPTEVEAFVRTGGYQGLNVTIPYKQTVLPLCDTLSDTARRVGSVNTLLRTPDGALHGFNTDYAGFAAMAARAGVEFAGRRVAVLGSGGTSLTAQAVATDAGAASVTVVSRSGPVRYDELGPARDCDLLVNTTPVGMFPGNGSAPVSLDGFPRCAGVLDVIYNPLRTALVQQAEARGVPAAGGLYMLAAQAAEAYRIFTGAPLPAGALATVYADLLREVENIVLIGMPGSGKSTLGRLLAERLGRPLLDTDAAAAEQAGKSVPAIFAQDGEPAFRAFERAAAAACGKQKGAVIATGGGVVLSEDNVRALRQNGRLFFLRRPLEALETVGRPLSTGPAALRRMYAARLPLYRAACDVEIDNTGAPERAVQQILEAF